MNYDMSFDLLEILGNTSKEVGLDPYRDGRMRCFCMTMSEIGMGVLREVDFAGEDDSKDLGIRLGDSRRFQVKVASYNKWYYFGEALPNYEIILNNKGNNTYIDGKVLVGAETEGFAKEFYLCGRTISDQGLYIINSLKINRDNEENNDVKTMRVSVSYYDREALEYIEKKVKDKRLGVIGDISLDKDEFEIVSSPKDIYNISHVLPDRTWEGDISFNQLFKDGGNYLEIIMNDKEINKDKEVKTLSLKK